MGLEKLARKVDECDNGSEDKLDDSGTDAS